MEPAHDVQLSEAEAQGLTPFLHDLLDGMLEAVGIAFLAGEGAELTGEDAVVGVVDIAIEDVAGALADFALADEVGDGADGVQVAAFEEAIAN